MRCLQWMFLPLLINAINILITCEYLDIGALAKCFVAFQAS